MTEYPVIIHPGTPITFRARWRHPNGCRMGLVGHFLYRAGVTGPWRRLGEYTAAGADRFARRRGFRHAACLDLGVAVEVSRPLPKANLDSGVNFETLVRAGSTRAGPLVFGRGDLLLETTPASVPASALDDGTPGSKFRYLRQLALHRRAARKKGWIGSDDPNRFRATAADRKKAKWRQNRARQRAATKAPTAGAR